MNNLKAIIDYLGPIKVADICGISVRAVYKWRTLNSLPRTDFTGETLYSEKLSQALNGSITADEIKNLSNPAKLNSLN